MNAPIFFFTAEDPREIPKGSRDPLRFLPVWTPVARRMIPYLTTVTPSYRGFLTRFLFHGLLEELEPALANGSIDDQWPVFCKFEQLCAFVRTKLSNPTPNFPGISGIEKRKIEQDLSITVGSDSNYWLVRSQKSTGYWGYYHQASLGSQILRQNAALRAGYRLSEQAQSAFQNSQARSIVLKHEDSLRQLLQNKTAKFSLSEFQDLAELFKQKPEQKAGDWSTFWLSHLLVPVQLTSRSHSHATLQEFAATLKKVDTHQRKFGEIWEDLALGDPDSQVTQFAIDIKATEAMIGLCEWVFDVCRMRRESPFLNATAEEAYQNGYNATWLDKLRALPEPLDAELRKYRSIALSEPNSFEPLARALIQRHKDVMSSRKSATWVDLDAQDMLTIRDPSNGPFDMTSDKYPSGIRWRYDYFLNSWLSVARELGFISADTDG